MFQMENISIHHQSRSLLCVRSQMVNYAGEDINVTGCIEVSFVCAVGDGKTKGNSNTRGTSAQL